MGIHQRKECLRCKKKFHPTGSNCKRCPICRREHELESHRNRWHRTYVKKGYDQAGPKNNAWKGGSTPAYYQKKAAALPSVCARCKKKPAVLVHHKDGNRWNSSLDNLERLCKRCHQLEHNCAANLPSKVQFKPRICVMCANEFAPTGPRGVRCPRCRQVRAKV